MNFWSEIERKNFMIKEQQILDCMWVYVYKFMKKKMLTKCKTCLVVWDNQQVKSNFTDIYTVTLAVCFFCVFMTLAAQFDLKLTQYDIINIFVHANLNETVFMKMSDEYWKTDHILKLNKILYRLQRFSLLWQQKLKKILLCQKFREILHESYCMTWNSILVFFYVDDIVLLYHPTKRETTQHLKWSLQQRFEIRDLGDLQWFLGVQVLCDLDTRKLWLCQDSYIEKIAVSFNLQQRKPDATPMSVDDLLPNKWQTTAQEIHGY